MAKIASNPFLIGVPVTGPELADRDVELKSVVKEVLAGSRLFLISPRRYGKTSLLLESRTRLQAQKVPVAYVDLYQATSLAHFLDLFARAVLEALEGTVDKAVRLAGEFLRGIRPTMTINALGQPEWTLGVSQQQADLLKLRDEVLALPQTLAERKKSRLAVFVDEFQEIRALDGSALEKALRAALQRQPRVSYVFAGSKESLMWEMVRSRRSPFFHSGPTLSLGPIPAEEFKTYLSDKFRGSGMTVAPGQLDEILAASDDVPFNVQYLCHALWIVKNEKSRVSSEDIQRAIEYILDSEGGYYTALWDQLSLHQRRTARALARSGGAAPFTAAFLRDHDLGPSASVARSLKQLLKREVLTKSKEGYRFADPFFKAWILSRMA
jgi:hypothetical protein